jgi:hypothetical protein
MPPIRVALAAVLALSAALGHAAAQEVPARWGPYAAELVDESGRALPTFEHRGRTYVLGALGQRYLLRVRNGTGRRIEVVASVDGRDVVDGRPAAFDRRGYVVAPYGEITIDGYRLSHSSVAAFRFSSVPRSYAARSGDARDVGVIGVAVFPERGPYASPPRYPPPQPPPGVPYPSYDAPRSGAAPGPTEDRAEAQRAPAPPPPGAEASPPSDAPLAGREGEARPGLAPAPHRPGLGTEFGEEHASRVDEVAFARAGTRPEAVLTVRYDDRPGLLALGIDVDGDRLAGDERRLRETATPFRSEPGWCQPPPGWVR